MVGKPRPWEGLEFITKAMESLKWMHIRMAELEMYFEKITDGVKRTVEGPGENGGLLQWWRQEVIVA